MEEVILMKNILYYFGGKINKNQPLHKLSKDFSYSNQSKLFTQFFHKTKHHVKIYKTLNITSQSAFIWSTKPDWNFYMSPCREKLSGMWKHATLDTTTCNILSKKFPHCCYKFLNSAILLERFNKFLNFL